MVIGEGCRLVQIGHLLKGTIFQAEWHILVIPAISAEAGRLLQVAPGLLGLYIWKPHLKGRRGLSEANHKRFPW